MFKRPPHFRKLTISEQTLADLVNTKCSTVGDKREMKSGQIANTHDALCKTIDDYEWQMKQARLTATVNPYGVATDTSGECPLGVSPLSSNSFEIDWDSL